MHPEQSFHVREIARITGKPAGTPYRELSALAEAGLLSRSPVGNQIHYRANPACPIYEELRGILRKTFGVADVLRDVLEPVSKQIDTAFMYGSIARGEERLASDIDVMIIGKFKFSTPSWLCLQRKKSCAAKSIRMSIPLANSKRNSPTRSRI